MPSDPQPPDRSSDNTEAPPVSKTAALLTLVRSGDREALENLCAAYLPILKHWAHGRLPGYARSAAETDDLLQVTLTAALERLDSFEPRREGAFLAYLRQILLNAIRKEIRKASSRPVCETLDGNLADMTPSTVEEAVGLDALSKYEEALAKLPEKHQEAIILRVEFGFSFPEIAAALECPSADAARMMVSRAMAKLVKVMA
jgi:RNA polymerase sigma-70 factor (ECF subfamily)